MQIIETGDGDLYGEQADVVERAHEHWEAYMRIGTTKTGAAILIRQRGTSEVFATKGLITKMRAFMQLMESATNDRFTRVFLEEADDQIAKLKAALGVSDFEMPGKDDKKDEPS